MADHITIGDTAPRVQYTGDGAQTEFDYAFPIFVDADLMVYEDDTLDTIVTDYTISGAGESAGGTVTFVTAPADGVVVTLLRRLAISRTTDFQEEGEFRAKQINDELDFQTAVLQQLNDDLERAVVLDPTDPDATLTLPVKTDRAGKFLAFDADGDAMASAGGASVAVSSVMEPVVQAATLTAARTALGLGSAAVKNTGTNEGDVVEVQAGGALPALDGSALTGIEAGATDAERANILLNAFRIQVVGGLSVLDMIDGVVDEFEDETGVDAPVSNRRSHTSASAYLRYSYSTYEALNAFDDNTGTYWFSNQTINTNSNGIDYLGVQLDAAYDITKARIYNVDQAPATVKIQYSDDGSAWSDAVASWSLSGSIGAFVETTWASVGSHAYWRVLSSSATTADSLGNAGSGWKCAELEFYEIAGGSSSNADYDATNDFYSPSTGTNMTLVSETTTAEAQPDEAHLVVWEEDVDSITLNTDLLPYATRDGGTTWTLGALAEAGSLGTGRILTATIDISGQPAGTTMAWKLVTANNKELKIHGVGLEWR